MVKKKKLGSTVAWERREGKGKRAASPKSLYHTTNYYSAVNERATRAAEFNRLRVSCAPDVDVQKIQFSSTAPRSKICRVPPTKHSHTRSDCRKNQSISPQIHSARAVTMPRPKGRVRVTKSGQRIPRVGWGFVIKRERIDCRCKIVNVPPLSLNLCASCSRAEKSFCLAPL